MSTPLYTLGYGARSLDAFLDVLRRYGVAYLIDIRSRPYSRYKPEFSRDALAASVQEAGIRYVYMGETLGGMPADDSVYGPDGKVVYERVENAAFYIEGITRLETALSKGLAIAILCSEGRPEQCHRSKLIGRTLAARGVEIRHIDIDDNWVDQETVINRLTGNQPSLFGDGFFTYGSRKAYRDAGAAAESEDESDGE